MSIRSDAIRFCSVACHPFNMCMGEQFLRATKATLDVTIDRSWKSDTSGKASIHRLQHDCLIFQFSERKMVNWELV
jgi:hypothetical protein